MNHTEVLVSSDREAFGQQSPIVAEYREALHGFLNGEGEAALEHAYAIGRRAILEGSGSLSLVMIHHEALADLMKGTLGSEASAELTHRASTFLAETLAPIELPHRGFQDAIATLRASEERYRTLVDTAQDLIYTLSTYGTITSLNAVFETTTGWKRSEWLGRSFVGLFHHDDVARAITAFEHVVRGETPPAYDLRLLTSTGSVRIVEFRSSPLLRSNRIEGVLGIARDVTDRKQTEERIREQAELLDATRDAIVVCDLHERISYWNNTSAQIYGRTTEEAFGLPYRSATSCDDGQELQEAFLSVHEHGTWQGEIRQRPRDSKEIIMDSRWTLIRDPLGHPISILIVATDITERRRLQDQLLRAQQVGSIGKLTSGIARDLNDVLAPILLGIQSLNKHQTDPAISKLLSSLEQNVQRGARLVGHIMTFGRSISSERTILPPGAVVSDMHEMISQTLPKKIAVYCAIREDLWNVRADSVKIQKTLLDLCVRAKDDLPNGGTLTLSAENAVIDESFARMYGAARPGMFVVFGVSATGPALMSGAHEGSDHDTTENRNSAAVADTVSLTDLIQSHEGFVRKERSEGLSRISVYIPAIAELEETSATVSMSTGETGHGELILVVDDEASIREITKATLEAYGFKVITATDGADAVAQFAAHADKVDLVVTDLMMPCMEGHTAIQAIRGIVPGARIVATSGAVTPERARELVGDPSIVVLAKPYTAERLLHTLNSVLRQPTSPTTPSSGQEHASVVSHVA